MAHDVNYNRLPYEKIYHACTELLLQDDYTFANLEFPICDDRPMSNYPLFNVHKQYVVSAIQSGIEVFSLANNHITDQGKSGVRSTCNTMNALRLQYSVHFSGIRETAETPFLPITIHYKDLKIGFLAITGFLNNTFGAELVNVVPYQDSETRNQFLSVLNEQTKNYDLFIVSFHGGREYSSIPDQEKLLFFIQMIQSGVHIVWAHHPHVLQPWFELEHGHISGVLLSSCGNFISGQTWNLDPINPDPKRVHTGESAVFRVTIHFSDDGPRILRVKPYPIVNYRHPEYGIVVRPLEDILQDDKLTREWKQFYRLRVPIINTIVADSSVQNIMR